MIPALSPGSRLGRWTLGEPLGAGSFGSAWKATDDQGRIAALKVLSGPPGAEVQALSRVCHPSIPSVLDAQGEPVPFVAMSLARGRTLTRMIRAGRATEEPAIAITAILADALAVLHHTGLSHGDIKPDNVVVGSVRRGEVMLVDFGLAGSDAGGTIQYAAPERLQGQPPSPEADVYALGLVLWEMLKGELPWSELGMSASLIRRRSETPALEDASPYLVDLVGRMLDPEPVHRPRANEVTDALAAQGASLPRITPELVRSRARTVHVPIPEVDPALERWLEQGGVLAIRGRRQLGCSHMVARAVTGLQARGLTWLRLSAGSHPWWAISEALADPALPSPPASLPEHSDPLDRAEAAAAAIENRAPGGLAILADDVETLDPGSLSTLEVLARRGHVAILCAGSELPSWVGQVVELQPLEPEGVLQLAADILGERHPPQALVERLHAVSAGVPGLVVELLARACGSGALVRRAQRWLLDDQALEALVARDELAVDTPALPSPLAARVGGLLAAAGTAQPLPRLAALLECSRDELAEALDLLLDAGLVRVEHEQARCAGQAAASTLRRACDEGPQFHRMLAEDLLQRGEDAPGRLGWHLVGGGDVQKAAAMGPRLVRAATVHDPADGARLADALWELCEEPALAAPRVMALQTAGRTEEALAFGESRLQAGQEDTDLLVALARAALDGGGFGPARAYARRARMRLGGRPVPLALVLVEAQALFRADAVDEAVAVAAPVSPPAPDAPGQQIDEWLSLKVVHAQSVHRQGDVRLAIEILSAIPAEAGQGRPARALLDGTLGRLFWHAGRFVDASEAMSRAAAANAGLSALDRARMLNNAGIVSYQSGRRLQALEHWEEALLLFERLRVDVEQLRVSVNLCVGYREAGRWERSRQAGTWAADEAAKRGASELEAMAAGNMGDLFLDQRAFTEAERWYLRATRVARKHGLEGELVELARRRAELAVLRGDADALDLANQAIEVATAAGSMVEAARSRALRAVCLARRGEPETVQALLSEATSVLRGVGAAGELAAVRLLAAEALLALSRPDEAVAECDKVVVFAEEMGHVALRTRADHLLVEARRARAATELDRRLERLIELAVTVARSQDDEAGLLDTIADAALELLAGERSFVLLCEPAERGQEPRFRVAASRLLPGQDDGLEAPEPSTSVVRRVLGSRTEVIAADLSERGDLREARSVMAFSLRSAMCVPMIEGEHLLGAIYVDSRMASEAELSRSARFMRALAAHAAIAVANSRRIQAIRDRALWAAEVAHDMRSPVSSMITLAELVRAEPRNPVLVAECADDILQSGRRAIEMAERLLTEGRAVHEPVPVDDLLGTICRSLLPQARVLGVEVLWSGGQGLHLWGDRQELGRILLNLVSNAIKYSDPGGLVTVQAESRGSDLQVEIRDRGPGIPQGAMDRIFQRGVQAEGARSGHGLGLSVVDRLVRQHQGSISATNHPEGGALFTLHLPLHRGARKAS